MGVIWLDRVGVKSAFYLTGGLLDDYYIMNKFINKDIGHAWPSHVVLWPVGGKSIMVFLRTSLRYLSVCKNCREDSVPEFSW